MTYEEAENIIYEYEKWLWVSCTCFQGNPPCGKCKNYRDNNDEYLDALIRIERG